MAKFSVDGLDDLIDDFKGMIHKASGFEGTKEYSLSTLFDNGFLSKHTQFQTFEALMKASGLKCDNQSDFDNIDVESLDRFIRSVSDFDSFDDMKHEAFSDLVFKDLGL